MNIENIEALINKLSKYAHDSEDIASWDVEEIDSQLDDILVAIKGTVEPNGVTGENIVLESIADAIKQHAPGARVAVFSTDEWDNGYFFSLSTIRVLTVAGADDDDVEVPGLDSWEADLTDLLGPVGRSTLLVLDLISLKYEETNVYTVEEIVETFMRSAATQATA